MLALLGSPFAQKHMKFKLIYYIQTFNLAAEL